MKPPGQARALTSCVLRDFEGIGNLPRRMSGKGFSDAVDAACHFIILIESILGFQGFSRPFPISISCFSLIIAAWAVGTKESPKTRQKRSRIFFIIEVSFPRFFPYYTRRKGKRHDLSFFFTNRAGPFLPPKVGYTKESSSIP